MSTPEPISQKEIDAKITALNRAESHCDQAYTPSQTGQKINQHKQ